MSKSWTDLSDEDFEQVLDNLSDPEYGQLTDAEFFGALKAMDEADEIKLTAVFTLVNQSSHLDEKGQLVFDKQAALPGTVPPLKKGVRGI